jgi:hypothetical protein
MSELAYIVHRTRGRMRLRVRAKRHDQAYFDALCAELQPLECFDSVRANSNTGSLILRYAESAAAEAESQLRHSPLLQLTAEAEPTTPALKPLLSGIYSFDQMIEEESAGLLNLRTLVVIAVALLAIRQIRRGELLGPALPMLWNALTLAGHLNGLLSDTDE